MSVFEVEAEMINDDWGFDNQGNGEKAKNDGRLGVDDDAHAKAVPDQQVQATDVESEGPSAPQAVSAGLDSA